MPKVQKDARRKTILVYYQDQPYSTDIYKSFEPFQFYDAIAFALPAICPIRIANGEGTTLELCWDVLRCASPIIAHDSDCIVQGRRSHGRAAKKAAALLPMILEDWGLENARDILPESLAPRMSPSDKKYLFAKQEDVDAGVAVKDPGDWTANFINQMHKLSRKSIRAHDAAIDLLYMIKNERVETKGSDWDAAEILAGDIQKAIARREQYLHDVATEGTDIVLFAGGMQESITEVAKQVEREAEEAKKKPDVELRTFTLPMVSTSIGHDASLSHRDSHST